MGHAISILIDVSTYIPMTCDAIQRDIDSNHDACCLSYPVRKPVDVTCYCIRVCGLGKIGNRRRGCYLCLVVWRRKSLVCMCLRQSESRWHGPFDGRPSTPSGWRVTLYIDRKSTRLNSSH